MSSTSIRSNLELEIAFQRKWRRITSFAYFTGSSLSIVSAATASVVAGFGYAGAAAVVAALATVFTSLEKVLLFRDKWPHHRAVETELDLVLLRLIAGEIDEKGALSEMEKVIRFYSAKLPVSQSAGGTP